MASALSPSGSGIPCWEFHHPQSKPGSELSHCFLVDLGRRLIWVGEGHGWAYSNAGLYTYHLQSHRTTNRDFRLGAQRAKLTFFLRQKKAHCFSEARKQKCGPFIVVGYASYVQMNITSDIFKYLIQTLRFVVSAYIAACLAHSKHTIKSVT